MNNLKFNLMSIIQTGLIIFLGLSLLMPMPASAAKNSGKQDKIKAAFMFGFIRHTVWPSLEGDSINFCVIGDSMMNVNMAKYLKRKIQNKMLTITQVNTTEQIKQRCHILYVPSAENQSELFNSISNSPILTVGEPVKLSDPKTIITFARKGIKLKYQVNKTVAERIGFKFSDKLLKSATKVN